MAYKEVKLTKFKPKVEDFFAYVKERYNIYKRKEKGLPPPWTDNEILQKFKFTNVFRFHDYGTQWIYGNNYYDVLNYPHQTLLQTVAYRTLNLPSTFEAVGLPALRPRSLDTHFKHWGGKYSTPKVFIERLQARSEAKLPKSNSTIWGQAYRASSHGSTPRIKLYSETVLYTAKNLGSLYEKTSESKSLKECWECLQVVPSVGPFIANEVALDLSYLEDNYFANYKTFKDDWVNIGPGAYMGLEMLFMKLSPKAAQQKIFTLRDIQKNYLPNNFPRLDAASTQYNTCEFRKYVSIKNGGGKRRKYIPRGE